MKIGIWQRFLNSFFTWEEHQELQGTLERDHWLFLLAPPRKFEVNAKCVNFSFLLIRQSTPDFSRMVGIFITNTHDNIPNGQVLLPIKGSNPHSGARDNLIKQDDPWYWEDNIGTEGRAIRGHGRAGRNGGKLQTGCFYGPSSLIFFNFDFS